jgi:hypothetical protein
MYRNKYDENIESLEKQLEEKYYGKLIYDFGMLYASEFVLEHKYDIMFTERDNRYYIVIKHIFDDPETKSIYTMIDMENAEKLRDFLNDALEKSKANPIKPM